MKIDMESRYLLRVKELQGIVKKIIYFSEEKHPRHYFHILVLLDKEFKPLKYSNNFYFNNLSIEFCIGFDQKDDDYYFWISNFDRDPELIITKRSNIHLCYDFCNV